MILALVYCRPTNHSNLTCLSVTISLVKNLLKMVLLHVKRGDESQFLFETNSSIPVETLTSELVVIFNGRLKVSRVCTGEILL